VIASSYSKASIPAGIGVTPAYLIRRRPVNCRLRTSLSIMASWLRVASHYILATNYGHAPTSGSVLISLNFNSRDVIVAEFREGYLAAILI
jgi:hypothetical protein